MLEAHRGFNKPSKAEDWTPLTVFMLVMKNVAFNHGRPGSFLYLVFISPLPLLGNFSWSYRIIIERSALKIKQHKRSQHAGTNGNFPCFRWLSLEDKMLIYVKLLAFCDTCLWWWRCCQGQWPTSMESVLFQALFSGLCMNWSLGPQTYLQGWVMGPPLCYTWRNQDIFDVPNLLFHTQAQGFWTPMGRSRLDFPETGECSTPKRQV